jgi:transposase
MQMLARGMVQADVAPACEVSRQTVSIWAEKLAEDRQAWRRRPLGRPGAMVAEQRKQLSRILLAGAIANGFATKVWTLARIGN